MYAGVEGGSTSTKATILDENGMVLGAAEGPSTNHWNIGLDECARRLNALILAAKTVSGLPAEAEIDSVGLTLSGVDTEDNCKDVQHAMEKVDPKWKGKVFVANDAVGAMATASDEGGIIVISGTGTVGMFVFPNGSSERVGGMGHMLGDEGSAYWIARYVIIAVIRHEMGIKRCSYDIAKAKEIIFRHYKLTTIMDILPFFYHKFEKSQTAQLTAILVREAGDDDLVKHAFHRAGVHLARLVRGAVHKKNESEHADHFSEPHLKVLCNGSVWKSWELLRPGFMETLESSAFSGQHISEITLLHLNVGASVGAACLGAKQCLGKVIHCDYSSNSKSFFHALLPHAPEDAAENASQ